MISLHRIYSYNIITCCEISKKYQLLPVITSFTAAVTRCSLSPHTRSCHYEYNNDLEWMHWYKKHITQRCAIAYCLLPLKLFQIYHLKVLAFISISERHRGHVLKREEHVEYAVPLCLACYSVHGVELNVCSKIEESWELWTQATLDQITIFTEALWNR